MKIDYKKYELFKELDDFTIDMIDKYAIIKNYHKNKIVHLEEDYCNSLEMVIKGNVNIEQINYDGNSKIIRNHGSGELFGLNVLFSSSPIYLMNVITTEETTIFKLRKSFLQQLIDNSNVFRNRFITILSDNSKQFGNIVKNEFRVTLRQKIEQYIVYQSVLQKTKKVRFKTTKTDLARIFGVERTSLSRELQKMKNEGIIDYDRLYIRLI